MVDKPLSLVPNNPTPKDSDYFLGGNSDNDLFQKTTLSDLLTNRFNPETNWLLVDGSVDPYSPELNSRLFIPQDATPFNIDLPEPIFGNTLTVYSLIDGVLIFYNQLSILRVKRGIIAHILWDGNTWVDFSKQAALNAATLIVQGTPSALGFRQFLDSDVNLSLAIQELNNINGYNVLSQSLIEANFLQGIAKNINNSSVQQGQIVDEKITIGTIGFVHADRYQPGNIQAIQATQEV